MIELDVKTDVESEDFTGELSDEALDRDEGNKGCATWKPSPVTTDD